MKRLSILVLAMMSAGLLCLAPMADAATLPAARINLVGTQTGTPTQTSRFGFLFSPTRDIEVTALGVYDTSDDGLATNMLVGLYRETGGLAGGVELARVTVPSGSSAPLIDRYRYVDLPAPERLIAGTNYMFATVYFSSGSEGTLSGAGLSFDPALGTVSARANQGNTITDLGWVFSSFGGSVAGPNFLFEVIVPEPATACLAMAGLCGMLLTRCRAEQAPRLNYLA